MDLNQTELIFALAIATLAGGFLLALYLRYRAIKALEKEPDIEQHLRTPDHEHNRFQSG